jgi:hypothetical protein
LSAETPEELRILLHELQTQFAAQERSTQAAAEQVRQRREEATRVHEQLQTTVARRGGLDERLRVRTVWRTGSLVMRR